MIKNLNKVSDPIQKREAIRIIRQTVKSLYQKEGKCPVPFKLLKSVEGIPFCKYKVVSPINVSA
jgi:hypothetical protein